MMRRSMQSERAEAARRRGTVAKSVLTGAVLGYVLASGGGFVNGAAFAVLFGACFGMTARVGDVVMTSSATWRNGSRTTKRATPNRRRWTCPTAGCDQERITPLDTTRVPICPVHAINMSKRRPVTRRRGL